MTAVDGEGATPPPYTIPLPTLIPSAIGHHLADIFPRY